MDAFESLEVWKRSSRLCVEIYRSLESTSTAYSFKDQLLRSSLSVPSNIAEGYERGTRKEFVRYLNIAKGSCAEMRTQLYIGIEAGIMERSSASGYARESGEISRMLQGLIRRLSAGS